MFALGIHYLNGWAMAAADGAKKERAEWPPHPDRVFMALAAAWFETGQQSEEGDALRWLEKLESPAVSASEAFFRSAPNENRPTVSYVPVNDSQRGRKIPDGNDLEKLKDAGLALVPEHRPRQPRRFPVAIPREPVAFLIWLDVDSITHRAALERLVRKVTHIGHPASFVQMWVEDEPPMPNWVPSEGQTPLRLRIFGHGQVQYLREQCNRDNVIAYADLLAGISEATGREKTRLKAELRDRFGAQMPISLRPEPRRWQGYDRVASTVSSETPGSIFDPRLIVLALSGKRVSLPATLKFTEALHGAILATCPEPIPEWVSGHKPNGDRSENPHLAMLPLPFVGHEYSDGRLMGVALALPKGVNMEETGRCLSPFLRGDYGLPIQRKLFAGHWFECGVELETRETPPGSLRSEHWTRSSRTWASVTPIVLDRHFDGSDKWERAADTVKDACERIGLPRPKHVLLHPVSLVEGVPHARDFPDLARKTDGGRRHHTHAVIVFDREVRGPVAIGAGRFRGYGLCRPMDRGVSNE